MKYHHGGFTIVSYSYAQTMAVKMVVP